MATASPQLGEATDYSNPFMSLIAVSRSEGSDGHYNPFRYENEIINVKSQMREEPYVPVQLKFSNSNPFVEEGGEHYYSDGGEANRHHVDLCPPQCHPQTRAQPSTPHTAALPTALTPTPNHYPLLTEEVLLRAHQFTITPRPPPAHCRALHAVIHINNTTATRWSSQSICPPNMDGAKHSFSSLHQIVKMTERQCPPYVLVSTTAAADGKSSFTDLRTVQKPITGQKRQ